LFPVAVKILIFESAELLKMVTEESIEAFHEAVKKYSEYDLSVYSEKSFRRRIEKLLSDRNTTMGSITQKVIEDPDFMEIIIQEITVNTTELFRDPKVWQTLRYRILKKLKYKSEINIWHAGSSTGQEVYSMLILLNEMNLLHKANLYASDINQKAIDKAKFGEYAYRFNIEYIENYKQVIQQNPYNFEEFKDIPFSKYFDIDKVKDIITAKDIIRNKAEYRKHDLVKLENIYNKKFDIILCRNVLIYFKPEVQNSLFRLFAHSLVSKGYLILGAHESILGPEARLFIKHGYFYLKK